MSCIEEMILLVEDNEDDVFLMKRAIKEARLSIPVHVIMDGQEAVDYLAGNGKYADRTKYPLPCCVFLDLKLPYKSGFEVFSWMREQPELKDIGVTILTSSPEERDRQRAAQLGANGYWVKPPTEQMIAHWFREYQNIRNGQDIIAF